MSIERHPNINIAGVASGVAKAVYTNLRRTPKALKAIENPKLDELIEKFCEDLEELIEAN